MYSVLMQYSDVGVALCTISMIALVLFFIASSDSGSMVDDIISANGLQEPCLAQRFWWAMTEGLAATALLYAGRFQGKSDGGLKALQSVSICVGLPYTFLICLMTVSMLYAVQFECKDRVWGKGFKYSVFDIGVTLYGARPRSEAEMCNIKFFPAFLPNGRKANDGVRLLKCIKHATLPGLGLMSAMTLVEKKKAEQNLKIPEEQRDKRVPVSETGAKVLALFAWFFFILSFVLCFVDYVPVNQAPVSTFGADSGDTTINVTNYTNMLPSYLQGEVATRISQDKRQYVSARSGWFSGWYQSAKAGDAVILGTGYDRKTDLLWAEANGKKTPLQGYRIGRNMRIEAFGWWFWFCFWVLVAKFRGEARKVMKIAGTLPEDLMASILWPTVIQQILDQLQEPIPDVTKDIEVSAPAITPAPVIVGNQEEASGTGKI